MFDRNLTKPKVTFLVNKEEALKVSDRLTDLATGAVDLSDGEIGLINKSTAASGVAGVKIPLNDFIDPTDSDLVVPAVKIVQGTSTSANPPSDLRPGVKRPYESSALIQADEKIWINIKPAQAATYSIWGISNINVEDETEYRVRIAFRGRWHDIMYSGGTTSTPVYTPHYTTPNYTDLITATTLSGTGEALDHLVKNLVVEINKNSAAFFTTQINKGGTQLVLALAIGNDVGGTTIATITPGVPVPIFTYNGPNGPVTKSYVFNAEQVASLQAAYPALDEEIVLADVTTIADVDDATRIALIGLDRPFFLAEDRLKETKVRLDIGLTSGFNTAVVNTELSNASEGQGYPRQIKQWYEETQERRDNDIQFRGVGIQKIQYPSDVLEINVPQDIVIITHSTTKQGAIGTRDVNLQSTVVLTPADLDNGIPSGTLGALTAVVPDGVEAWARQNNAFVQVTYDA
jgi:hypothetical protein